MLTTVVCSKLCMYPSLTLNILDDCRFPQRLSLHPLHCTLSSILTAAVSRLEVNHCTRLCCTLNFEATNISVTTLLFLSNYFIFVVHS